MCGDSYQCHYDYVVTLRRDFAVMTKYYQDQFVNIKHVGLKTGECWARDIGWLEGELDEWLGGGQWVGGWVGLCDGWMDG